MFSSWYIILHLCDTMIQVLLNINLLNPYNNPINDHYYYYMQKSESRSNLIACDHTDTKW